MQSYQERPQFITRPGIRTILVVEDDVGVGSFLVAAIRQETRHDARLVGDGVQALNALESSVIDLVILDYNLPQMNGLEVYDRLYSMQGSDAPPVVMISARLPIGELAKRHVMSMQKPLELDDFLDMIERLLPNPEEHAEPGERM